MPARPADRRRRGHALPPDVRRRRRRGFRRVDRSRGRCLGVLGSARRAPGREPGERRVRRPLAGDAHGPAARREGAEHGALDARRLVRLRRRPAAPVSGALGRLRLARGPRRPGRARDAARAGRPPDADGSTRRGRSRSSAASARRSRRCGAARSCAGWPCSRRPTCCWTSSTASWPSTSSTSPGSTPERRRSASPCGPAPASSATGCSSTCCAVWTACATCGRARSSRSLCIRRSWSCPSPAGKLVLAALLGLLNSGWYAIPKARLYEALPGQSGAAVAVGGIAGLAGAASRSCSAPPRSRSASARRCGSSSSRRSPSCSAPAVVRTAGPVPGTCQAPKREVQGKCPRLRTVRSDRFGVALARVVLGGRRSILIVHEGASSRSLGTRTSGRRDRPRRRARDRA